MIISKLDAARIQLDQAIELFFNENHVCAVTLAGAATEIMETFIKPQNSADFLLAWYQKTSKQQMPMNIFKKDILNAPFNWLKHSDRDPNSQLDIGIEFSLFMLMRALACYQKLVNEPTLAMKNFWKYVQDNKDHLDELFR